MVQDLKRVINHGISFTGSLFNLVVVFHAICQSLCLVVAVTQHHFPKKTLPMLMEICVLSPEWYFSVALGIVVSFVSLYYSFTLHGKVMIPIISKYNCFPMALSFLFSVAFSSFSFFGPTTVLFTGGIQLNNISIATFSCFYLGIISLSLHIISFLIVIIATPKLHFLDSLQFRSKYVLLGLTSASFLSSFLLYINGSKICGIVDCIGYVGLCGCVLLQIQDYKMIIGKNNQFDVLDTTMNETKGGYAVLGLNNENNM